MKYYKLINFKNMKGIELAACSFSSVMLDWWSDFDVYFNKMRYIYIYLLTYFIYLHVSACRNSCFSSYQMFIFWAYV